MDNLEERLSKLNPNDYDEPSRSIIKSWKTNLPNLHAQVDWISHPVTQEFIRIKIERVKQIKDKISENPDISELERQRLFGEKACHELDISTWKSNGNAEKSLETISKSLELE